MPRSMIALLVILALPLRMAQASVRGQDAIVPFALPSGGKSIALRNGGTEPLNLLTVTMTTARSAATPMAGTPAS